jgi:DNA-binding NarL/FixJ family response regulator
MGTRILVVDDHDVVRHGVLLILRSHPEWEIVGEAGDGFDAIAKTQSLDPDLVILDISMPRKDGLEVLTELVQMKVRARILVLTMHESTELAHALRTAGAFGYVVKTQAARDLVRAVQNILAGTPFFPEPAPTLEPSPRAKSTANPARP